MTDPGFDSHVLVVAGSGIFIVGRYVEFGTLSDSYIFISLGTASADLGPFLQACQRVLLVPMGETACRTVSRAIAKGRPASILSASLALSITDWWY